jgi:hypothetical protein
MKIHTILSQLHHMDRFPDVASLPTTNVYSSIHLTSHSCRVLRWKIHPIKLKILCYVQNPSIHITKYTLGLFQASEHAKAMEIMNPSPENLVSQRPCLISLMASKIRESKKEKIYIYYIKTLRSKLCSISVYEPKFLTIRPCWNKRKKEIGLPLCVNL